MRQAYAMTAQDLEIKPVSEATNFFNPMGQFLHSLGPVHKPRVDELPAQGLYECLVNLAGGDHPCEGLGLCNSGCGSERKRNALQVYLPRALARDCELVPHARVVDIKLVRDRPQGAPRVGALIVEVGGHLVEVKAQEVVLCAGAIGSSVLLLTASDVRQELERRRLPVGRRFCANVGSPLCAFFGRVLHPRPSLQISHYYMPPDGAGFILETWFAPPGTLALAMPGYFNVHWERMLAYSRTVTAAPLVGTEPQGSITVNADRRVQIRLPLGQVELERLRTGITTLAGAILQAGDPDLIEVVAGTRLGFSIKSEADLRRFEQTLTSPAQLRLGTGHPQGGNAMTLDLDRSVVDEQFQVRDIAHLRVCDASVFPEVAGVNPQWTIMALAHHCAQLMTA
jgi:choline dehydrogenase-like flavoprotein